MAEERVKIVLDADVIIHFSKGGYLSLLPQIFPDYEYVVLDKVYNELSSVATQLDNQICYIKNITKIPFQPSGQMLREYAMLKSRFGDGESACMAYCKFTSNIIGSSNLRDIRNYCSENKITYLTTIDFLYFAWYKRLLSADDCHNFILEVKAKGSRLPDVSDITKHIPVCSI
jgi:predicted nucleic acid-binding protein